jgi:quercetin dioxygenase-like cupin family protein
MKPFILKGNPMRSLILIVAVLLPVLVLHAQNNGTKPTPRITHLDPGASQSLEILTGAPMTVTMRSGYVVLAPGKSVGKHSTRANEEALVVLAGKGELRLTNGPVIPIKAFDVTYCPPEKEHDVFNTGTDTLRYLWLVAKAKP